MIDVWLLFLIALVVFTIISHTIITIILGPESAENKNFSSPEDKKRLFNRRNNHSANSQRRYEYFYAALQCAAE